MANPIQEIIEKQVLTVAKAMEDKIDDEIASLDKLEEDDLEVLREGRLKQMKKMAEKRKRWISLGHGEYTEIPSEKDFFAAVKASERVVCHFYRENWPCKGRTGRAFLFSHAMNIVVGAKEDRHLLTGLHTVADISCANCNEPLGWKYERAYGTSQKYKAGKFIFEKAKIAKEDW